jgi:hypothetical protein
MLKMISLTIYKRNEYCGQRTKYQAEYSYLHAALQDFLLCLLDDVEKYFKSAPPMSEEKSVASVNAIFAKVQKDFPLVAAVSNLAKKLVADIRDKIADVSIVGSSELTRLHRGRRCRG